VDALQPETSVKYLYGAGIGPRSLCTVAVMEKTTTTIADDRVLDVTITDRLTLLVDLPSSRLELDIRQGLLLAARLGRSVEKVLDIKKAAASITEAPSPLTDDA